MERTWPVKTLSEKMLLCINENPTSLHLSPSTAMWGSYRTKPSTHYLARFMLSISHTLHCLFYRFATHMFQNPGQFHLTYLLLPTMFEVDDGDFTTLYITGKYGPSPESRLEPSGTSQPSRNMRRGIVVMKNTTTSCIAGVHCLTSTSQSKTVR